MSRSIKELGETQRCPKCNTFAKITGLVVSGKETRVYYHCDMCMKKYKQDYTNEEFISMAKGFLIDDEWIPEFQRKYMIATQEFVTLKGGLDGAYFAQNKEAVKKYGKALICKEGNLYRFSYVSHKKSTIFFNLVCTNCGKKKFKINRDEFFELGRAGLVPTEVITDIKDTLESDDAGWDSQETYYVPSTVLSADARARLGMEDDEVIEELEGVTCPKCGAGIQIEMKKYGKCPTCGHPLSI